MTTIAVSSLFVVETAAKILETGLAFAKIAGLPVTSWRTGDPTRSLYKYLAEVLAAREDVTSEYIKAGFLSSATGDWLKVLALEVYGVEAEEATYATPDVTLTNGGGAHYEISPGDITLKSSTSGKTFHNTSSGTLSAGATVTFNLVADEAGSDSTVAVDEVDTLVTTLLGVTVDSSTAATAQDEQSEDSIKEQCESTLGALSPNGPPDAYEYVARNSELTGVTDITRAKSLEDSATGDVTLYVAGASGAVAGASVTAAQTAVETWATPLTITPTVVNSTGVSTDFTATISGTDIPADFESQISDAYAALLAAVAIATGGGEVSISLSRLYKLIHDTIPEADTASISAPAADVVLSAGEVPTPGTVSISEV